MIGFETIGNATLTVFDDKPVLSTDPWVYGSPYFGSWGHKYSIPSEQITNIQNSKYIWLSHGHPDHIDYNSFKLFRDATILVPDHYGDRIYDYFSQKYKCIKLKSNEWFEISKNIRIKSFSDWNQDGALLVEILKKDIIFNQNDGQTRGWTKTIKNIIKNYENKFLLRLINWGDADMINIFDHHQNFILPQAANKPEVGIQYHNLMKSWNCNYAIPFSAFHKYIRKDSIKMNQFITPLKNHSDGFKDTYGSLLPAFIRWDCLKNDYQKISVEENNQLPQEPGLFGDNWSDDLDKNDIKEIQNYFLKIESLKKYWGIISFKVGSKEINIKMSNKNSQILFEAPRKSLMMSIKKEIFDDMLIGNFMKTTIINKKSLYPYFSPFVAKYSDNGNASSIKEIKKYFDYYKINSADYWRDMFLFKTEQIIRDFISPNSIIFKNLKKIKQKIY